MNGFESKGRRRKMPEPILVDPIEMKMTSEEMPNMSLSHPFHKTFRFRPDYYKTDRLPYWPFTRIGSNHKLVEWEIKNESQDKNEYSNNPLPFWSFERLNYKSISSAIKNILWRRT